MTRRASTTQKPPGGPLPTGAAWIAFVRTMEGEAYGREALLGSWIWFRDGWDTRGMLVDDAAGGHVAAERAGNLAQPDDLSRLGDPEARSHPAWPAFARRMIDKSYGSGALRDAWYWFRGGWDDPLAPHPMSRRQVLDLVEHARAATAQWRIESGERSRARWEQRRARSARS